VKGEIILTNEYTLYKYANGWKLEYVSEETKQVKAVKTGELTDKHTTWTKYYGSLYQGLQGFARAYYEDASSIDDIAKRVLEVRDLIKKTFVQIETLDKDLAREYKIVKVSKN